MSTTYKSRTRDQGVADNFLAGHGQCRTCGVTAEWQTLSDCGARCGQCHGEYLLGGKRPGPMPSAERKREILASLRLVMKAPKQPREWAHRLRERELFGERLSLVQKQAWRMALKGADDAPAVELRADAQRYADDPRFAAWEAGRPA